MSKRWWIAGATALLCAAAGVEKIADTVEIGTRQVSVASLPGGVRLLRDAGVVAANAVEGEVVFRSRREALYETRATLTPRGDFLLMFPEGKHYGTAAGKVNDLIALRSEDGGRTWGAPNVAFDIDYSQHGFIPLIPRGSRRIYAFGTQPIPSLYTREQGKQENAPIGFRWSDDHGFTWSKVELIRPVNDPEYRGMSVMRMTETDRGSWILGTHDADWSIKPLRTRLYLLRSEDKGKTWRLLPGKRPDGWYAKGWDRMDEGRPLSLGHGKVILMSRTPEGHLWLARSQDDGRTWTDPQPTPLIHPDAPPMLFLLSDGKTLAAFHHNRYSMKKYEGLNTSPQVMKDRSEIWVSLSSDEGRTWSTPRFIFANALEPDLDNAFRNYQCSYMDAVIEHGTVHLFVPHRWQRVLHLRVAERELSRLPLLATK